ncbi:hypothetical protein [uncultured Nostoc sp.]|uniref:hypothetical protein n=1 Tax=uncultured Nostoc sp. TaxID=340711 RepID=UPI00260653DF|nr:hypothetical protein [uncultured Nostoc sp.]
MLFTTLTAQEEASLSGGNKKPHPVKTPPKTTPPKTTTPVSIIKFAPIETIIQTAVNINTGDVKGDLTQTAVNQLVLPAKS